jgi:hypothetical protein
VVIQGTERGGGLPVEGRPGYHQQIHVVKPNALVETIDVAVLLSALIKVFDRVSFDKHNLHFGERAAQ